MILRLLVTILFPFTLWSEEPPEPEYPYPKVQKHKDNLGLEKPIEVDSRGAYIYSTEKKNKNHRPPSGVERPYRVDEDGSYYYGPPKAHSPRAHKGVEAPVDTDDEGGYYYSPRVQNQKPVIHYGERPKKIETDGTFIYTAEDTPSKNTLYLRGGMFGPPDIRGSSNGARGYRDIYNDKSQFVFAVEYDWKILQEFYIKASWGFTTADGTGQFASNSLVTPRERFQFFIFPMTANLGYKFQFWDVQYLTPYFEGGPGYFGFVENRSDGKQTRFGGAPVLSMGGGLMVSLSKLIGDVNLRSDYGVTQSWFDIQYKQILGLDSRKDFSSNMITLGFALGF